MATATALLSPGGDGGVLVLEGPSLADAAALSSRLRALARIESRDPVMQLAQAQFDVDSSYVVDARSTVRSPLTGTIE